MKRASANLAVTTALHGLEVESRFADQIFETFAQAVAATGTLLGHSWHYENLRLVGGSKLVQARLQLAVKRHGNFLPGLLLNVGERPFGQIHVIPFHAAAVGKSSARVITK
jgi:hypothetical protein